MRPPDDLQSQRFSPTWIGVGIAVAFFALIAPTLTRLEFSSGSENLNVATVLEMRRGGPWVVPTLKGTPRVTKPPLTAWTTAAAVSSATVASLSTPDRPAREAAYRRLAWEVRWPALALSCAMLVATFDIGRTLAGVRAGAAAAVVAGTTIMFLRYGRSATTDVQLALWVTVANACLLRAAVGGGWWAGCVGAGVAIGLALLSKGPVALVQTVVPLTAWAAWFAWRRAEPSQGVRDESVRAKRGTGFQPVGESSEVSMTSTVSAVVARTPNGLKDGATAGRVPWRPVVAGVLLAAAIGLPWFAHVLWTTPDISRHWASEVTRAGATDLPSDPFYNYLSGVAWLTPWAAFFVIGLVMTARAAWHGDRRQGVALALVVVPVVVMSFFKDKPERYLLPLLGPASVVTAVALAGQWRAWRERSQADRALAIVHWATLLVIAVGLPVAGATILTKLDDGAPWYAPPFAAGVAVVGAVVVVGFYALSRTRPLALLLGTAVVMLGVQPVLLRGYADALGGRAEMKAIADHVWATAPDADVSYVVPQRPRALPVDLNIYLNRLCATVASLDAITPSGRPQVAVVLQRGNDPPPAPPAPWRVAKTVPWGNNRWWHALERPAE